MSLTRLLELQDNNGFQISEPQCPSHCTPLGNGDVLHDLVHRNVRLSDVNVLDILHSDHLSILLHILDHVTVQIGSGAHQASYPMDTGGSFPWSKATGA
jgi:hypothetical protein